MGQQGKLNFRDKHLHHSEPIGIGTHRSEPFKKALTLALKLMVKLGQMPSLAIELVRLALKLEWVLLTLKLKSMQALNMDLQLQDFL
jgi:hypothetical protein|uniref:Uncharacterized protein n=1 Tax=Picea glauca TaxID=3330 RepID=A0A117NHF3_PICGL|nr:hypothetical protein ABT39_MTgene5278 [Picea glauca]QHR88853.1 hypothetical protein Q903MT_gene2872 [Picea sitchensis]